MPAQIQTLIEERPHLAEPLQFYVKWIQFQEEAVKYLPKDRSTLAAGDHKSYPVAKVNELFHQFLTIFNLPEDELLPLERALVNGEVDFMRLPLGEMPQIGEILYPEEELARILFLFAKPYFHALRENFPLADSSWEKGRCPLCSAPAVLASISEGPKRQLHCSFCGTTGSYRFIGCPNCESSDSSQLSTLDSEDEPGFRIITCDDCRTYTKVIDASLLTTYDADLADLASLPLDIIAQENGYERAAPNPISLKRIK
jgi:FdhE protein